MQAAASTARAVAAMKRSLGGDGRRRRGRRMFFVINNKIREWAENQVSRPQEMSRLYVLRRSEAGENRRVAQPAGMPGHSQTGSHPTTKLAGSGQEERGGECEHLSDSRVACRDQRESRTRPPNRSAPAANDVTPKPPLILAAKPTLQTFHELQGNLLLSIASPSFPAKDGPHDMYNTDHLAGILRAQNACDHDCSLTFRVHIHLCRTELRSEPRGTKLAPRRTGTQPVIL